MRLILHIRGAATVTVFVAAAVQVHAQVAAANLTPTPMNYQQVVPGVTLRQLSPVVYFRAILGMSQCERDRALAGKSPEFKKAILDKVREYQALPPDVREERLRQTQILSDLITLIQAAPADRAPMLKDESPSDRALLESRLRQWDTLPKAAQTTFLTNATFLHAYARWLSASTTDQQNILNQWPATRRQEWTNELAQWQSLPEDRRAQLCEQFRRFFDLDPAQQQSTLTAFTDEERKQMESALAYFARLAPDQRLAVVASFQKFATLPPRQRDEFLSNAARWEAMTADERKLWRSLVQIFPVLPSSPDDNDGFRMPPFPPLPPVSSANQPPPGATVASESAGSQSLAR